MSHSLEDYLQRQTTKTLHILLEHFSQESLRAEYEDSLKIIKDIIKKREE